MAKLWQMDEKTIGRVEKREKVIYKTAKKIDSELTAQNKPLVSFSKNESIESMGFL